MNDLSLAVGPSEENSPGGVGETLAELADHVREFAQDLPDAAAGALLELEKIGPFLMTNLQGLTTGTKDFVVAPTQEFLANVGMGAEEFVLRPAHDHVLVPTLSLVLMPLGDDAGQRAQGVIQNVGSGTQKVIGQVGSITGEFLQNVGSGTQELMANVGAAVGDSVGNTVDALKMLAKDDDEQKKESWIPGRPDTIGRPPRVLESDGDAEEDAMITMWL